MNKELKAMEERRGKGHSLILLIVMVMALVVIDTVLSSSLLILLALYNSLFYMPIMITFLFIGIAYKVLLGYLGYKTLKFIKRIKRETQDNEA